MKKLFMLLCVMMLIVSGCGENTSLTSSDDQKTQEETNDNAAQNTAPVFQSEITADYKAVIEVEDYGTITLELDQDKAPKTVDNFVKLVEDGFYDGLTFHRIYAGFMIQGGDPLGNGYGGSEEEIEGEFAANGFTQNDLTHIRGAISMARSQAPDSASSQFFIVHEDSQFLDGNYAAFGYVIEGMEVVDAICKDARPIDDNGTMPAEAQPIITSITVEPIN